MPGYTAYPGASFINYINFRDMKKNYLLSIFGFLLFYLLSPSAVFASISEPTDLTGSIYGYIAIFVFVVAYAVVIGEEFLHLRKSKPVMVGAGAIWILVALAYSSIGDTHTVAAAIRHNLLEYAELMLFLLAAMTYVNTLQERNVFEALRSWLVSSGFSFRAVFWLTGILAFLMSPIADNMTTSLIMAAVVMAIGAGNPAFISLACINIVVAANAGGAFSPFGDITTLMVWQKGMVQFSDFFQLLIPSFVNWIIPAIIMAFAIPDDKPVTIAERIKIKQGGVIIIVLFLLTIALTVSIYNLLYLPPFVGMMTGLGVLKLYGNYIRRCEINEYKGADFIGDETMDTAISDLHKPRNRPFDIYVSMKRVEWDTLMFFYGVILCIGGLGTLGYLAMLSEGMYVELGPTWANILVGILSAIIDNIPVMFSVLSMQPDMPLSQWLLVTLTAGVGGSLLSIGSAAGVAIMGQARGAYTFFGHLKWTWAIALGYAASIWVHLSINS